MKIAGLQKTTLVDYPGLVACTIFLYGCNFRCGFCYNPDLVINPLKQKNEFSRKEIIEFLKKKKENLDAVCITGGEPLLTLKLDFLKEIRDLGYKIKIDTNGSNPEKLKEIIERNLVDYIAMDIKGSKEHYSKVSGVEVDIEKIEESIKLIYNFGNYEFRTTVVSRFHNEKNFSEMGEWINSILGKKPEKIYLQGFKKNGGTIDKSFSEEKDLREKDLKKFKDVLNEYFEEVIIRG